MINIKAQQTLVKFNKQDPGTWLYLMRPETYSKLTESKVIDEAAVREQLSLEVGDAVHVKADWRVLPCHHQRVGRRYGVPEHI